MAKKTTSLAKSKTLRRTSTMQKAVAEGQSFLAQTKKKKATRTRTMTQTIKEGQQMIAKQLKKQQKAEQSVSQSAQPKVQQKTKKQKKIIKNKSTKKVASNKEKSSKTSEVDKKNSEKKSQIKKNTTKESTPLPTKLQKNIKKTIFKTKSKDHLPIPAFGFIDVCFCIDATGSMSTQLAQAQSTILSIINNIQNKVQTQGLTLRFAIVSYRDHAPQDNTYVTKALDFTDGHQAGEYVKNLQAIGGGDFPEAVHDGLMHCCKNLNWIDFPGAPILRYIFHIADAPPHGKLFGNLHEKNQGCLCGMSINEVYHEINLRQIHYRLIKARSGPQLELMQEYFRKGIVDFNSADLSNAKQMDVKVSDMIIHEMLPVNA